MKNRKARYTCIIFLLIAVIVVSIVAYMGYDIQKATEEYNSAASMYNEIANKYKESLAKVCVDNIEGIPLSVGQIKIEDTDIISAFKTLFSNNSAGKIRKDAATIYELVDSLEHELQVIEQIKKPSDLWVVERLKSIGDITGIGKVYEGNDPNQMLEKAGGYTACVYFTLKDIDSDSVEGTTIVDKGTDAGGAIEVYANVEDAKARCEYLSEFDDTLLYSGSYAIVGTMVIRISYRLDGKRQLEMTNKITKAFTALSE